MKIYEGELTNEAIEAWGEEHVYDFRGFSESKHSFVLTGTDDVVLINKDDKSIETFDY